MGQNPQHRNHSANGNPYHFWHGKLHVKTPSALWASPPLWGETDPSPALPSMGGSSYTRKHRASKLSP